MLAVVLKIGELESQIVVVLDIRKLVLRHSGLKQVVVVHKQVHADAVHNNKPIVAPLVEEL